MTVDAAHPVTLGMKSIGIDLFAKQLDKAREWWPGVDELHKADTRT